MARTVSTRDVVPGFAEMLRGARERRGLTLAELAATAGLSVSGVSEVERGIRAPSLRVAAALARALGVVAHLDDPAKPLGFRD